ncbi:hypothetical protein KEM48_013290 [Puccinia striiformis f. sp. tritici PST-130]|nr:hypothetical protein KEM48_013290 [Puccinia striiformis f. sp. tritici PST-130]
MSAAAEKSLSTTHEDPTDPRALPELGTNIEVVGASSLAPWLIPRANQRNQETLNRHPPTINSSLPKAKTILVPPLKTYIRGLQAPPISLPNN